MYVEMQLSIDCILGKIKSEEKTLNEISEHLFNLLEKRSLFRALEYLALKLLQDKSCTIDKDFAAQLESYRAMKKGNTAPDIELIGEIIAPGYKTENTPRRLSDINSRYTVVIFGASWCPLCPVELSQIVRSYPLLKAHNVEVVFVSLDENQNSFQSFARVFPFISVCDYKKWESPVVKNYHVFATPTIFLLDNTRKIVLRPNSAGQLDTWVDWYLVKGNK
jgi:thiol-disulfide isomerase/thioredoxin